MRKLLVLLATLAVMAALSANPGSAFANANADSPPATPEAVAPARWNRVGFTVRSDGEWTREPRSPRYKSEGGNMYLSVDDNLDGGVCVRLRSARTGQIFAGPVCWADGTYGQKMIATNVRGGTSFTVEAKKGSRSGTNSYWAGWFEY